MAETKYYLDEEGLDKLVELVLERINSVKETADSASTAASNAQSTADEAKTGLTDGSVTKVGTATVGSGINPIYLDEGVPKVSDNTVGSEYTTSVFLDNGELKETQLTYYGYIMLKSDSWYSYSKIDGYNYCCDVEINNYDLCRDSVIALFEYSSSNDFVSMYDISAYVDVHSSYITLYAVEKPEIDKGLYYFVIRCSKNTDTDIKTSFLLNGHNSLIKQAQSTADSASTAASNAQSAADKAQSTADSAQSAADKAQSTADSASTAASNAQSTADSAQSAADKAQSTVDDLSTEFYNESVRPNVIRNTNDINELGSVGTWDAGTWRQVNQSGSTRTSIRIDVDDAPDPHISCGVRCYTESGSTYAKIRQDGVPMEEGAYYTASFYARGSGKAQFQYGMSPYVATNFDVTDDWERYSVGFTFVGADCASTDGSTYIYFGTGSAATVEICGMMLEKWDEMTDWMPNPLDAKDITARETAESAQSIAQEASDEISDLKDMSISTSNGSAVSATFGFETIGIPRTLNDDGSYKGAFDTIKDYWEQLETRKVYIAFVDPQQQYVAIIQKYTGDHNYGSVFIQGYGFSTPRYYRISNGTWYEVTLADNAAVETAQSTADNAMPVSGIGNIGFSSSTSKDFPIILTQNTSDKAIGVELCSYNDRKISLQIGSGGSNRGVYDNENSGWIIYKDSSDDVHLGTSTIGSSTNPVYMKSGVPTACSLGSITSASSTVTCGNGGSSSYTGGASITLDSGTYLIVAAASFTSQSTEAQYRVQIYCTTNSTSYRTTTMYGKYWVGLQAIHPIKLSSDGYVFRCRISTSLSSTLADCTTYIYALKI